MEKSKYDSELSTFIESCGSDTLVCHFAPATALTINAVCDCASHHIILNALTTRKIIEGGMSTQPSLTLKAHRIYRKKM